MAGRGGLDRVGAGVEVDGVGFDALIVDADGGAGDVRLGVNDADVRQCLLEPPLLVIDELARCAGRR